MNVGIVYKTLDGIAALQRPNKPNLLEGVVDLFESESLKNIAQVQEGVKANDLNMIRMGSHCLKSSSANIGAVDLSNRCRDIEYAARHNELGTCIKLSVNLMEEFERSVSEIRNYMEKAA